MAWGPGSDNRFSDGGRQGPGVGEGRGAGAGRPGGPHADADADADLDDALARFASDARTEERVGQRRRQRWLARAAAESTTLQALLDALAELGGTVALVLDSGTSHRGVITVVGDDVVALADRNAGLVLVALGRLAWVDAGERPALVAPGDEQPLRPNPPSGRPTLRHLLAELADDEPEVRVTAGGATVDGRLLWVGDDVAALAEAVLAPGTGSDAGRRSTMVRTRYVRLSSVTDVSLSVSG